jgi:hypothetical protein
LQTDRGVATDTESFSRSGLFYQLLEWPAHQPAKEAQLDYLALPGVDDSESLQRIIERH